MKRNLKFTIGLMVLLVTLVSTYFVSGTFAKYTTSVEGTATAIVARWSFEADEASYSDAATTAVSYTLEGSGASNKIAPGDSGHFSIFIDASGSDVAVKYTVTFTIPVGLTLKLSTETGSTIVSAISGIKKQQATMQEEIVIYWFYNDVTAPINSGIITFEIKGDQNDAVEADVPVALVA